MSRCILSLFIFLASAHAAESPKIQIKKFRFHQHLGLDFERLVLEFSQNGGNQVPAIQVSPGQSGKEATLNIAQAVLVGAIPEATINDSYSKTSRYIGPISISNDNPTTGFTIRTFVKNTDSALDAFWLKNPTRLIVDVFPKSSARAQGPEVLRTHAGLHGSRGLASRAGGMHGTIGNKNVICFFTAAQVQASLGFELGTHPKPMHMAVDDSSVNYAAEKNVICYPSSAQAQPTISFDIRTGDDRAPDPAKRSNSMSAPPPAASKPAWSTGKPLTKDEKLNRDADLALGLPGDDELEGRGLASPGLFDGSDTFDKNRPPPSLGKSLVPGRSGGGRSPLLANPGPGGLLPPVRR